MRKLLLSLYGTKINVKFAITKGVESYQNLICIAQAWEPILYYVPGCISLSSYEGPYIARLTDRNLSMQSGVFKRKVH